MYFSIYFFWFVINLKSKKLLRRFGVTIFARSQIASPDIPDIAWSLSQSPDYIFRQLPRSLSHTPDWTARIRRRGRARVCNGGNHGGYKEGKCCSPWTCIRRWYGCVNWKASLSLILDHHRIDSVLFASPLQSMGLITPIHIQLLNMYLCVIL